MRLSPDFLPTYAPLLRLALALRQPDPPAAQTLLEELARLAPAQTAGREAPQRQPRLQQQPAR